LVSVRLGDGLVEWVDGYAKKRGVSRTEVLNAAVREFRDACEGGVPEVKPGPSVETVMEVKRAVSKAASTREHARGAYWDMMRERQERLNKGGR
jgi:hypothetical protein